MRFEQKKFSHFRTITKMLRDSQRNEEGNTIPFKTDQVVAIPTKADVTAKINMENLTDFLNLSDELHLCFVLTTICSFHNTNLLIGDKLRVSEYGRTRDLLVTAHLLSDEYKYTNFDILLSFCQKFLFIPVNNLSSQTFTQCHSLVTVHYTSYSLAARIKASKMRRWPSYSPTARSGWN